MLWDLSCTPTEFSAAAHLSHMAQRASRAGGLSDASPTELSIDMPPVRDAPLVPAGAPPTTACGVLSWRGVTVTVKDAKGHERQILKAAEGVVAPGELAAIMGACANWLQALVHLRRCLTRFLAPCARPVGLRQEARDILFCMRVRKACVLRAERIASHFARTSTLLDSLAGRLAASASLAGDVRINGHAATSLAYGRSAYVTQDEVLIGTLTVRETITYAARLRLRSASRSACSTTGRDAAAASSAAAIADGVIAELGLTDAADTVIGNWHMRGVSGGQRRRVVIGCELVIQPTLLFLDEPTSGLDAAAAFHVTGVIKRLCAGGGRCAAGRTVLCVIHQPASEVYEQFDTLALLQAGRVVYFGPAQTAADFFASVGLPAPRNRSASDHLLHAINQDFGDAKNVEDNVQRLMAAYEVSPARKSVKARIEAAIASPGPLFESGQKPPPALLQIGVLTQRTFVNNVRDLGVFWIRVVMYSFLCLVIGFLYFRMSHSWRNVYSRAALLFFVCAFLTFMSISGFPAFVEDMKVFTRERLNGYYGVATFVLANTTAGLPFIALIALGSTCAVYFIAGLNLSPFSRCAHFFCNLFASLFVAESLMMAIAAVVSHFLVGIAAGAGVLGLMMLVCGFFQPRSQLPRPVLFYPLHFLSFQARSRGALWDLVCCAWSELHCHWRPGLCGPLAPRCSCRATHSLVRFKLANMPCVRVVAYVCLVRLIHLRFRTQASCGAYGCRFSFRCAPDFMPRRAATSSREPRAGAVPAHRSRAAVRPPRAAKPAPWTVPPCYTTGAWRRFAAAALVARLLTPRTAQGCAQLEQVVCHAAGARRVGRVLPPLLFRRVQGQGVARSRALNAPPRQHT